MRIFSGSAPDLSRRFSWGPFLIVLRSIAFSLFLYLGTLIIGILCLPLLLGPRSWNLALVRWWCRWTTGGFEKIIGVRTEVRGLEHLPEGAKLIASKHQAMWETVWLFNLIDDPAVVLKKELMFIPIFGWWAAKLRMISIDRGAHAAALKAMMKKAKVAADESRSIIIFPEGTRAEVGKKNEYKPGVAALYKAMDKPCVPIALNSGRCWPRKGNIYRPGVITVEILPPIEPGLDRASFMAELETRIETATAKLLDD